MTASTPPTSSNTPYHHASPFLPTEESPGSPITRSRTLYYLSVRDSNSSTTRSRRYRPRATYGESEGGLLGSAAEERAGLMGDDEGGRGGQHAIDIQGGGLPPRWVDTMDEIEDILSRSQAKLNSLEKLHAKHVLPAFTDRTAEEREIEAQTIDITRDLRKMQSLVNHIRPNPGSDRNEVTTAKNVQRALAVKLQHFSAAFRKKQKVYMQQLQGHAIKNKDLLTASGAITLKGPESYEELEEDIQASHAHLTQTQRQRHTNESTIRRRDAEITQIAESITELADLFRDMSNLVVEQGTVLDSVEYNVEMTSRELEGAVEELKVAQTYQRRTGKRKCILLLILIIIGLIIVLIYKPRSLSTSIPKIDTSTLPAVNGDELQTSANDVGSVPSATRAYETLHPSAPRIRPPSLPQPRPSRRPRPSRTRTKTKAPLRT
ncbi:hypothetical protein NliqN6_5670 [Naganishia liquefaciens]|uniref:t-SNARE coiled-coil homology domain-containing protein n=1 Tax=Naganishia liquefaciens TaxID=104408 RepID=A0A8H3TYP9_9TREE|nr:hypothetical protein NliqN6_5670 [Naganishia liquefaciens]